MIKKILHKQVLSGSYKILCFHDTAIASRAQCGQVVFIQADAVSRRIPLAIMDQDARKGLVTVVVHENDSDSKKCGLKKIGDEIYSVSGPIGNRAPVETYGNVVCIGFGYGIAQIFPVARQLRKMDNKVIGILGAESKSSVILESQMRLCCNKLTIATEDGSYMRRGVVTTFLKETLKTLKVQVVFAAGDLNILEAISQVTKEKKIKTYVGLLENMSCGTGLCGTCRTKSYGRDVLTCADGPFFDGHKIDFSKTRISYHNSPKGQGCQSQKFLAKIQSEDSPISMRSLLGLPKSKP